MPKIDGEGVLIKDIRVLLIVSLALLVGVLFVVAYQLPGHHGAATPSSHKRPHY